MDYKSKISQILDENKTFNGGFSTLTSDQLDKLKGGLRIPGTDTNIFNCGNCSCINVLC